MAIPFAMGTKITGIMFMSIKNVSQTYINGSWYPSERAAGPRITRLDLARAWFQVFDRGFQIPAQTGVGKYCKAA
jgi:hypothetical protein